MPVQQQVARPCVRLGVGRLHEEVDRVRGGEAGILGAEGLEPREDAGVVGPQEKGGARRLRRSREVPCCAKRVRYRIHKTSLKIPSELEVALAELTQESVVCRV